MTRTNLTPRGIGATPCLLGLCLLLAAAPAVAQEFTYHQPGDVQGTTGRVDQTVYVPGMTFPIQNAPAYANSQIYGHGGYQGPGGGQCDTANYSYPWRDNYCEARSWGMPLCPSGKGHQGQDIRPSTCVKGVHPAVAAEAGTITSVGSYSVYLTADSGTRHRYLHLDMKRLAVRSGQRVSQGQFLGYVSNDFGGTATTIHLHYDLNEHVSGIGKTYVPTYMSLIRSYENLLGGTGTGSTGCDPLPAAGGVVDDTMPCFRLYGPATTWRRVTSAGHGGSLYWTKAYSGSTAANWVEWQLGVEKPGRYHVEVWVEPGYGTSKQSRWTVRANGEEKEVRLDLSSQTGWRRLGTYEFADEGQQYVRTFDNTGEDSSLERRIPADAVRLVPDDGTVEPEPEPEPTPDPGTLPDPSVISGCAVPREGGIIDGMSCLTLYGPSQYWRKVDGAGYGGSLVWTKAFDGSDRSNWARWIFSVDEPGVYKLEMYNTPTYGTSQRSLWGVSIDGQGATMRVDLSGKSGWVDLGLYTMRPGTEQRVAVLDNTGEPSSQGKRINADALRLVRVGEDNGATVFTLPAGNGSGGGLSEGNESADAKGFLADAPGVPLSDDELGADAPLDAGPGEACTCSSVRAADDERAPGGPLGLALAALVGLIAIARRRRRD